ncbi:MFS transporter [Comamonas odontotermitis]|uniref:MFS transporter n=1 Tax=Comamonas odontotermitis TaxID=379895 RepID=UPI003750661A
MAAVTQGVDVGATPMAPTVPAKRPWHFWAVLVALYVAQGVPSYLMIMTVPAALRAAGMPLQQVGMLSILMLPLVLKFIWAPWVDRLRPLRWGHRRGWIVCTQLATVASVSALAWVGPQAPIGLIVGIGMCMALSIATQDIATDGYATQQLRSDELGRGNAIQAASVAGGVLVGGSLAMFLVEHWGWYPTMGLMALLCLLPLLALPWMQEPGPDADGLASGEGMQPHRASIRRFFARPGVWTVLGLAVVYRLSEGMLRSMESSYLLHSGLSLSQVGLIAGSGAAIAGLAGSYLAARWLQRSSRTQVLLGLSTLRVLAFVLFLLHSLQWLGGAVPLAVLAVGLSVQRYMEMVALYALFMSTASRRQPGTDFSILACAELTSYMLSSMAGGFIAKQFQFSGLFAIASVIAVGCWLATYWLLQRQTAQTEDVQAEAPIAVQRAET